MTTESFLQLVCLVASVVSTRPYMSPHLSETIQRPKLPPLKLEDIEWDDNNPTWQPHPTMFSGIRSQTLPSTQSSGISIDSKAKKKKLQYVYHFNCLKAKHVIDAIYTDQRRFLLPMMPICHTSLAYASICCIFVCVHLGYISLPNVIALGKTSLSMRICGSLG